MTSPDTIPADLHNLGDWLRAARVQQALTQKQLAVRCGIAQSRISRIEKGEMLPTLPQLLRLAQRLAVPLQWFLNGSTVPGQEIPDISMQLCSLGIVDLFVPKSAIPGAFLPIEEVLALAVRGNQPETRIIEALPAVLAWNRWFPKLLRCYCFRVDRKRAATRLAWLADIALTIHRTYGFPGGCPQQLALESFIRPFVGGKAPTHEDALGHPATGTAVPPFSKRWKITYDAPLSSFVERARHLHSLRER